MLSIKNRLIALSLSGLITACLIGSYCYYSIEGLNSAMNNIVVSTSIMRNHMYADMMHDALNSDVNGALLSAENVGTSSLNTIETELKEHSDSFMEALNNNNKLMTDKKMRDALEKTLPALRSYIASAESIVRTAKTDREAAIKMMDGFHKAFTTLEGDMESLTELIEENVKETQADAQSQKKSSLVLLFIIFIFGVAVTLFFSLKTVKNIIEPLFELLRTSERVASGDLSVRVNASSDDELGQLAQAMEKMRVSLADIISNIGQTTERLSVSVEEISTVTTASTTSMLSQQSETDQVASAMNEMTATVHEVARNIVSSSSSAQKATHETRIGREIVAETVQSISLLASQIEEASSIIHRLEQNSHNISSVLDVIRTIAEQTNLLALNAAIEAARAGEQGRGFAVVADEVRTLASRTQASTGEINEMISQLQEGSKSSVDAMTKSTEQAKLVVAKAESAGQSLQNIADTVDQISALSAQIATAAEEQTAVSEEINRNILHINEAANITAGGTHKTKEAMTNLRKASSELESLMTQFKI